MTLPLYPGALWLPAHPTNYRVANRDGFSMIVQHCTDGHAKARPVGEMWQEPHHGSSAHFAVDNEDGSIIQAVSLSNVAYHAHAANSLSVGIENCARTPGELGPDDPGLPPSDAQYAANAKLTAWLCKIGKLAPSRSKIRGHSEVDSKTTHTKCPLGCGWDWEHFISLVIAEFNSL